MQGDRKFMGEVDAIMGIPFRIGSDGVRCWWVRENHLVTAPFESIEQKRTWHSATRFMRAAQMMPPGSIRDRKLEYLGEVVFRGRRCHLIRSWKAGDPLRHVAGMIHDWSIDAETFSAKPGRDNMIHTIRSYSSLDFNYNRINQPIPDEEFRPADCRQDPETERGAGATVSRGIHSPLHQRQRRQQRPDVSPLGDEGAEGYVEQRTELRACDSLAGQSAGERDLWIRDTVRGLIALGAAGLTAWTSRYRACARSRMLYFEVNPLTACWPWTQCRQSF